MGWVVPAIIAGKGIIDYFGNKKKEKNAAKQGRQQYNDYYSSPYMTAVNQYLRQYWNEHGLAERFGNQPGLLDSLLQPRPFDENDPRFKSPGAGGRLGGAFMDAIAAHYAPQTRPTVSSLGRGSNVSSSSLGLGSGDYPAGTGIGAGLPGTPAASASAPMPLPVGRDYGPSVGAAMGTSSRDQGPPVADADPYDAESILQQILRGEAPGEFDGTGAAYARPLRRVLRTQGL